MTCIVAVQCDDLGNQLGVIFLRTDVWLPDIQVAIKPGYSIEYPLGPTRLSLNGERQLAAVTLYIHADRIDLRIAGMRNTDRNYVCYIVPEITFKYLKGAQV